MAESPRRISFIVGPTGTGKNRLALEVAPELQATIVNADSVQFYKSVDIGANKPSPSEMEKVPHALYGCVDYPQEATAALFVEKAKELFETSTRAHFLLVGGSGFYIQALEKGMPPLKPVPEEVRGRVEKWTESGDLYTELQKLDPEEANRLHENDHYRLARALAVILTEGKTMEEIRQESERNQISPLQAFEIRKLGLRLDREELKDRIEARTKKMLEKGLLEECRILLSETHENWAPLSSIGYKECVQVLKQELSENELVEAIVKSTMALAKRQETWFKRDPDICWFHPEKEGQLAREFLLQ